jgi:hypothetical protein
MWTPVKRRYCVDSRDGYTHEFVLVARDADHLIDVAREKVTELFPPSSGPYDIWDLEQDNRVASFDS